MISLRLGLAALFVTFTGAVSIGSAAHADSDALDLGIGSARLLGDESSYLTAGAGAFNIQDHRESSASAEGNVEFHYGSKLFYVGPAVGLLATVQGGFYGYAGGYADIAFGQFVLTPFVGMGAYHRGGGEDLGGVFEFRESLDLAYQFDGQSRLGVQFAHLSNGGINGRNSGDNEVLVTYAIPLQVTF